MSDEESEAMDFQVPPLAENPVTPLEFLTAVYSCNELPLAPRLRAAVSAAGYVHPKLAIQQNLNISLDIGEQMRAARQRTAITEVLRGDKQLEDFSGDVNEEDIAKAIEARDRSEAQCLAEGPDGVWQTKAELRAQGLVRVTNSEGKGVWVTPRERESILEGMRAERDRGGRRG